MKAISVKRARLIDKKSQRQFGISGLILMENAGIKTAELALKLLKAKKNKKVCLICGRGNNAGDGFVTARHLINAGIKVTVLLLNKPATFSPDALSNYKILKKLKADFKYVSKKYSLRHFRKDISGASLIIDAVFGIGFKGVLSERLQDLFKIINNSGETILAVDVPSGLDADGGKVNPLSIKADYTITFALAKKGFYLQQGPQVCGKIIIDTITFPKPLLI
jgi:NAD(P)H-hydrate epimerase